MEHDSSLSGYHEPEPGDAGPYDEGEDWGDDFPKAFSINLIWAQAKDKQGHTGAIGINGQMPWHLKEDLQRFKELTVSHPVIMGRKTWDSLKKKPLPNRDNIVISHNPEFHASGASVAQNIEVALDYARQEAIPDDGIDRSEIWIIGGAQVYSAMLREASKVFVTEVDTEVEADTYAPNMTALVETGQWEQTHCSQWFTPENTDSGIRAYRYLVYERKKEEVA